MRDLFTYTLPYSWATELFMGVIERPKNAVVVLLLFEKLELLLCEPFNYLAPL